VIALKYTPIGEKGHTQSILSGVQIPITGLRKSLLGLLNDIKKLNKNGYTILATHDPTIQSISVFDLKPNITVNKLTKVNHKGI